jgi:prevent-host-death family protein
MVEVASRELRNGTAGVLAQVQRGDSVTITVNGKPVALLTPLPRSNRRHWIGREDLARRLLRSQADAGLRNELRELAGDTTDDLGPL